MIKTLIGGLLLFLIVIGCTNSISSEGDSISTPPWLGEWRGTIHIPSQVYPENITVDLTVNKDSSYSLVATNAQSANTVLYQKGSWTLSEEQDIIYLAGTECSYYDETENVLVDYPCGDPLALTISITDDKWVVPLGSLPIAELIEVDMNDPMVQYFLNANTIIMTRM